MGRIPRVAPAQPITHLWERHREIMRRLVAGETQVAIATSIGMTEGRLSIICNSPAFQQELRRLSAGADDNAKDVQARMQELSIDAMTLLENALIDTNDQHSMKLKVNIAQDVLDRAGYGAVKKVQVADVHLTLEDIMDLKSRASAKQMQVINV